MVDIFNESICSKHWVDYCFDIVYGSKVCIICKDICTNFYGRVVFSSISELILDNLWESVDFSSIIQNDEIYIKMVDKRGLEVNIIANVKDVDIYHIRVSSIKVV